MTSSYATVAVVLSKSYLASAIPLSASLALRNQSPTVGFVQGPNGRGTLGLIVSCVLTLILCVWSALHLNIPAPHEPVFRAIWRNACWILVGVYAPELVVFTAWRQWSSAKQLSKIVEKSRPKDLLFERFKWTRTHSFFACTGGFAFEIPGDTPRRTPLFLPRSCPQRLTLTARGVAVLAKCGRLPDVREEDIEDKSKANALAKSLVVVQALWMLLQVLGRLTARLPVTLLEVNTVAHVLCALLMYALWWHKPLLPNEPFILTGDWVEPLCAYMYMCSEISGSEAKDNIEDQTRVKKLFASLNFYTKTPEVERLCLREETNQVQVQEDEPDQKDADTRVERLEFHPAYPECKEVIEERTNKKQGDTAFFERRPRVRNIASAAPSEITLQRWRLAAEAVRTYPSLENDCKPHDTRSGRCIHPPLEQYVVRSAPNWPSEDLLRTVNGLTVGIILWMSNFLYGGLHALAWHEFFSTTIEKWLWRSAAVYISFCGGFWVLLNSIVSRSRRLNEFWEHWMDGKKSWVSDIFLGSLVLACGLSFIVARAFIVLEAFVSLRELPLAAYDTPSWSQIWPHF